MKTWGWIGVIALGAVLVFAATSAVQQHPNPDRAYNKAKEETKEAFDATKNYVRAEAEQAKEDRSKQIDQMQNRLAQEQRNLQAGVPSAAKVQTQMAQVATDVAQDQEKTLYQEQVEQRLDQYGNVIKDLKARADDAAVNTGAKASATGAASDDATQVAKAELAQMLNDLERRRDEAQRRLGELKDSHGDGWKDAKASLDETLSELDRALERTRTRIDNRT